ncbi:hypothetical protein COCNU_contig68965000G000010 [Cocos nucifera]|nr:hypothetical protein [Cocos nucifera]
MPWIMGGIIQSATSFVAMWHTRRAMVDCQLSMLFPPHYDAYGCSISFIGPLCIAPFRLVSLDSQQDDRRSINKGEGRKRMGAVAVEIFIVQYSLVR